MSEENTWSATEVKQEEKDKESQEISKLVRI